MVRTENAAKPAVQASRSLSKYISNLDPVGASFDYGCGKLRYAESILYSSETLTVVDSEIQIARMQNIQKHKSSVREVARQSNRMIAVNTLEFSNSTQEFERGFCINVLSAIPFQSVRRQALALIRQKLHPSGSCLFVVQYRNSDFGRMSRLPNARPWLDGFLMDSRRGFSFYGLITPQHLINLVVEAGFHIGECHLDDGRVYLMAHSPGKPKSRLEVVRETGFATLEWPP